MVKRRKSILSDKLPESLPGILRVKLGACLTYRTRLFRSDLYEIATSLNVARTAMLREWERWHEDHPDYDGMLFAPPPGAACPFHSRDTTKPVSLATYLYHVGRCECPEIMSSVLTDASSRVVKNLLNNMPYNHWGNAEKRWQAILCHEADRGAPRSLVIPWPKACSGIAWNGMAAPIGSLADQRYLRQHSDSAAILKVSLWSQDKGREHLSAIVRFSSSKFSDDPCDSINKGHLRALLRGEPGWEFSDSTLVWKPNNPDSLRERRDGIHGEWYLHLAYQFPGATPLDKSRMASLRVADPDSPAPFFVNRDDHPAGWRIGHGRLLQNMYERLDERRTELRQDYYTTGTGRRGHGSDRFYLPIRPVTRQIQHLLVRVGMQAAAEAAKYCERNRCGTLVYYEPPLNNRAQSWFAARKIQWEWQIFLARLKRTCDGRGILLVHGR